jgi:hypothetical protein
LFDRHELAGVHLAIAEAAAVEVELNAVAISERLCAFKSDLRAVEIDFAYAPKGLGQNVTFESELSFIGGVLILASTASAEDGTRGRNAVLRRLFDMNEARALGVPAGFAPFGFDGFTRQNERREDDFTIQTAEAFAAVDQFFNVELQT